MLFAQAQVQTQNEKMGRKKSSKKKSTLKSSLLAAVLTPLLAIWALLKLEWDNWLDFDQVGFVRENPLWILVDIAGYMFVYGLSQVTVNTFALRLTNDCHPGLIKYVMPKHCMNPQPPPNITDFVDQSGLYTFTASNGLSGWIEGKDFEDTDVNTDQQVAVAKRNQVEELKTPYYLAIAEFCPKVNRAIVRVTVTADCHEDACIGFEYAFADQGKVFFAKNFRVTFKARYTVKKS